MSSNKVSKSRPKPKHQNPRQLKRKRDVEDVDVLRAKVGDLDLAATFDKFNDLPLSKATNDGLEKMHFRNTTDIQKQAIPLGLKGADILGAAKTGSGKTLAFLIPVLENLYRQRWTAEDGLGALIMAPTRELAMQIFEVLRKVGRYHMFSAGLVIGGEKGGNRGGKNLQRDLQEEKRRLPGMNILICTPGRMLQHLDQTASLGLDNLQMLIMDEADRIMDMGFKSTVDAIVEHLPTTRQTMLFSATQTKKLDDLRRLSVQDPQYVSVHEKAETATPQTLKQSYIVTALPQKSSILWSLIRANVKSKTLVFLSSAKQVRFFYETFRHMQPGVSLYHLHGRQKQPQRDKVFKLFSEAQHACLFSTDVAARGLDFPAVNLVIQNDCPEDVDTYIHRVGRTARNERSGQAILFLNPSEKQGMLKRLEQKKIPIEQMAVPGRKQEDIQHQLQNMCFKDPEIKYIGQKAFITYVRSIHMQHDKEIFQIDKLPLQEFAASLGLPGAPQIKFRKGADAKATKNRSRDEALSSSDEDEQHGKTAPTIRTKVDRMFERQNQDVLSSHRQRIVQDEDEPKSNPMKPFLDDKENEDEDAEFLSVRRRLSDADLSAEEDARSNRVAQAVIPVKGGTDLPVDSKRREKMLTSKKALLKYGGRGSKLVFDADGKPHEAYELEDENAFKRQGEAAVQRQSFVSREAARVQAEDGADKAQVKQKRREKLEKRRARERAELSDDDDGHDDDGVGLPVVPMEYLGDDIYGVSAEAEEGSTVMTEEPVKKPKKWFQQDDSDQDGTEQPRKKRKKSRKSVLEDAETIEDLEALAASYM